MTMDNNSLTCTELGSHANTPLVGKYSCILAHTSRKAKVHAFLPDYKSRLIPVADATIRYECPFSNRDVVLLAKGALHVPAMNMNLIPPFCLQEAGITVNNRPKIHSSDLTVDDHSIILREY